MANSLPLINSSGSGSGAATFSDLMSGTQNLLNIFSGKNTSEVSGTNLSTDAVNALIKQILESNQGLATVASGQKSAGLYNSTVNTQLVNDLISRAAGQTAVAAAPKYSNTQVQPQADPVKTILGLAGGIVANKAFKASGASDALDKFFNNIFGNSTQKVKTQQLTPESVVSDDVSNAMTVGNDAGNTAVSGGVSGGDAGVNAGFESGAGVPVTDTASTSLSGTDAGLGAGAGDITAALSDAGALGVNADAGISAIGTDVGLAAGADTAIAALGTDAAVSAGTDFALTDLLSAFAFA